MKFEQQTVEVEFRLNFAYRITQIFLPIHQVGNYFAAGIMLDRSKEIITTGYLCCGAGWHSLCTLTRTVYSGAGLHSMMSSVRDAGLVGGNLKTQCEHHRLDRSNGVLSELTDKCTFISITKRGGLKISAGGSRCTNGLIF